VVLSDLGLLLAQGVGIVGGFGCVCGWECVVSWELVGGVVFCLGSGVWSFAVGFWLVW